MVRTRNAILRRTYTPNKTISKIEIVRANHKQFQDSISASAFSVNKEMDQNYFQNQNIKNPQAISTCIRQDKINSCSSSIFDGDFSDNELNLAFIAEDSKILFSDSNSVVSDSHSISAISKIKSNYSMNSPHFCKLDEQISGMEEWSMEHSHSFKGRFFKRLNPCIEQEQYDEDVVMGSRCTKKRINEKMKVVTIKPLVKKDKIFQNPSGYLLRSRGRRQDSQNSSDEQMWDIINEIEPSNKKNQPFLKKKF